MSTCDVDAMCSMCSILCTRNLHAWDLPTRNLQHVRKTEGLADSQKTPSICQAGAAYWMRHCLAHH